MSMSFLRRRTWHEWKVRELEYRAYAKAENLRRYNRQRGFIINPYRFAAPGGPTDPDFAFVVSLIHFDDLANTYTDIIPGHTWTRYGTTTVSSAAQVKYGAGALAVNSTGPGGITTTAPVSFDISGNVHCIELWAYHTSLTNAHGNQGFLVSRYNGTHGLVMQILTTGEAQFLNNTTGSAGFDVNCTSSAGLVATGGWAHFAFNKHSSNYYGYYNGVSFATDTGTNASIIDQSNPFDIGGSHIANTLVIPGFIDDFRFTNGATRYPSGTSFTPPVAAFLDS